MEESIFQIAEQIKQLHKKAYDIYLPLVDDVCRREVSEKELSICSICYWILHAIHLSRNCFWCEVIEDERKLLDAESARWLLKNALYEVQWLSADITLIAKIEKQME